MNKPSRSTIYKKKKSDAHSLYNICWAKQSLNLAQLTNSSTQLAQDKCRQKRWSFFPSTKSRSDSTAIPIPIPIGLDWKHGGGGMHGGGGGRLRNPCLTMHQPWASLLVHGIKRVEGRSWPSPLTGSYPLPSFLLSFLLQSKINKIKIDELNWKQGGFGSTRLPRSPRRAPSRPWRSSTGRFTPSTESPTSPSRTTTLSPASSVRRYSLLLTATTMLGVQFSYSYYYSIGCVEVVGCVTSQELASWEHVPQSVSTQPYPITTTCTFPIPIIFFTTCRSGSKHWPTSAGFVKTHRSPQLTSISRCTSFHSKFA